MITPINDMMLSVEPVIHRIITTPASPGGGFYYEIKPDDTLSAIAKAYSDAGHKVTVKQILEKNPGLKAENLKPGTKILIPSTTP